MFNPSNEMISRMGMLLSKATGESDDSGDSKVVKLEERRAPVIVNDEAPRVAAK